ncbi:MAG: thioredoxin fold domain-containing protein [Proteobacteria bacterium]|nr:thioredoxin fold domain-containing protein [Pseudomonadota bacterium]
MKNIWYVVIGLFIFISIAGVQKSRLYAGDSKENQYDFNKLPVKGVVTLVDLGAKKCIPCKMMAPILEKLGKSYKGKAAIAFIDVWENRAQANKYKIRSIPTQIFFDSSGKEIFRHVGFMSEKAIIRQLSKMGVNTPTKIKG